MAENCSHQLTMLVHDILTLYYKQIVLFHDNTEQIPNSLEKGFREISKVLSVVKSSDAQASLQSLASSVDFITHSIDNKQHNEDKNIILDNIDMLCDFCWEKLHTGHWKDVSLEWRLLYSLSCLVKACVLLTLYGNIAASEAMLQCDKALMMGSPVTNDIIQMLVAELMTELTWDTSATADAQLYCNSNKIEPPIITQPLPIHYNIPLLQFQNEIMGREPILINEVMNHWPCMSDRKWSIGYLLKVAGMRLVPVEIGQLYTSTDWSQKLLKMSDYIKDYVINKEAPKCGYLAQHNLFDQIKQLRADICVPDYCALSLPTENIANDGDDYRDTEVRINAWFGPAGTVSPLHNDPPHNLLCQIMGKKYVRLYNPDCSSLLYCNTEGILTNTSQVDVENPDLVKYPQFSGAPYKEAILNPGQMLYIPPLWWHFVKSLEVSFSVNFWWE